MSEPGWYPDPEGSPGRVRYWDGASWGSGTRSLAAAQAVGRRRPVWPWAAIAAVLAVAVLAATLLWPRDGRLPGPDDGNSSRPTGSVWDERGTSPSPTPSPPPSPGPSSGSEVACPTNGGPGGTQDGRRVTGGGLTLTVPDGFDPPGSFSWVLVDRIGGMKAFEGSTWASFVTVGLAQASDGFTDTATTASQVLECHLSSSSFSGGKGYETSRAEATTVGGRPAWRLTAHAPSETAPGGGATYEVVVVDAGREDGFPVYWGGAVDADKDAVAAIEAAIATLELA